MQKLFLIIIKKNVKYCKQNLSRDTVDLQSEQYEA